MVRVWRVEVPEGGVGYGSERQTPPPSGAGE